MECAAILPLYKALDGSLPFEKPEPNPDAIRRAVEMILEAERPMLMPGGGVITADAAEELVELAEYLQVPVSPTYMGKGSIPEDHPLYAGIVGLQTQQRYANQLFLESDLVVGIGNRWAERHTGDLEVYRGNRKFVHIDIDPRQIGRVFPADLAVVSDAKLALQAMNEVARDMIPERDPDFWVKRVDELRWTLLRKMDFDDVPIKPQRVFKEINEFFDEDTIFVTAIGLYQIWSGQFQKTYKPRHYLCCGQAGPVDRRQRGRKETVGKTLDDAPGPDSVMHSTEQKNTPRTTQENGLCGRCPLSLGALLCGRRRGATHVTRSYFQPLLFPRPPPSSKFRGRGSP